MMNSLMKILLKPFVAKNVDNKLDIVAYSDKNPTHVCIQIDVNAEFS